MRRRRIVAASIVAIVVIVGAGAAAALVLNSPHRVVVVRVARRVHNAPTTTVKEYPAASGAQSQKSVEAELAKSKHSPTKSSGSGSGVLKSGAHESFERLADGVRGQLQIAVQPLGSGAPVVLGSDESAHGWSTTKVPVLVSLMRARGSGGLTSEELDWARSAITESNNESVLSLFSDLERLKGGLDGASAYMESVLQAGGDGATSVPTAAPPAGAVTTFGQTEWSPGEAVTFFRSLALGCLLGSEQTSYVLGLMRSIVPSESWGLGSAGFDSVAFKGGWGPEGGGYLVRQSGIVDPTSSDGVAVAIVNRAPDFASGTETLTRAATWLREHLVLEPRAHTGCE